MQASPLPNCLANGRSLRLGSATSHMQGFPPSSDEEGGTSMFPRVLLSRYPWQPQLITRTLSHSPPARRQHLLRCSLVECWRVW
jgi:hypothetical protein